MRTMPLPLEPQTAEAVPRYVVNVTAHANAMMSSNVLTGYEILLSPVACATDGPEEPVASHATVCYVAWHAHLSHAYPAVQ